MCRHMGCLLAKERENKKSPAFPPQGKDNDSKHDV